MKKILIIVIDGCATDYLSPSVTPNIYRIGKAGFMKTVKAAVPTVTNVNHATILTGLFPDRHGVTGNYYYNRETGEQGFIESAGYIKAKTLFQACKEKGMSTALLTVKGKYLMYLGMA